MPPEEAWRQQRLDDLQVVYLWVDGIYVKAGLEKERPALLVVIAGLVDGRKVVVAVTPGHRESIESWSEVLRDLRDRGMNPPKLVVGDGNLGIWGALRNVWPEAHQHCCWNHKILAYCTEGHPCACHGAPVASAICGSPPEVSPVHGPHPRKCAKIR